MTFDATDALSVTNYLIALQTHCTSALGRRRDAKLINNFKWIIAFHTRIDFDRPLENNICDGRVPLSSPHVPTESIPLRNVTDVIFMMKFQCYFEY